MFQVSYPTCFRFLLLDGFINWPVTSPCCAYGSCVESQVMRLTVTLQNIYKLWNYLAVMLSNLHSLSTSHIHGTQDRVLHSPAEDCQCGHTHQVEQLGGSHHWKGGSKESFQEGTLAIWITPQGKQRCKISWWMTLLPCIKEYPGDTSTSHDRPSGGWRGHGRLRWHW